MSEKAKLFGDEISFNKIIECMSPKVAKSLGRKVQNYNEDIWNSKKEEIVIQGNLLKFSQNVHLKDYLLGTEDKIIVEASPFDKIWGIGMTKDNPAAENPKEWLGENLLGFALMEVRDNLKEKN